MTVAPTHLNTVGTAHGGATMALLDVVHAAVSNSHGTVAVAQDVHTEFLAPGRPGDVLVGRGRRGAPHHPHRGLPDRGPGAGRPAGRHRAGPGLPHRPPVGASA